MRCPRTQRAWLLRWHPRRPATDGHVDQPAARCPTDLCTHEKVTHENRPCMPCQSGISGAQFVAIQHGSGWQQLPAAKVRGSADFYERCRCHNLFDLETRSRSSWTTRGDAEAWREPLAISHCTEAGVLEMGVTAVLSEPSPWCWGTDVEMTDQELRSAGAQEMRRWIVEHLRSELAIKSATMGCGVP